MEQIIAETYSKVHSPNFKFSEIFEKIQNLENLEGNFRLLIFQLEICQAIEQAILNGQLTELKTSLRQDLQAVIGKCQVGDYTASILIVSVHFLKVLDHLIMSEVTSLDNFIWSRHLRHYMVEGKVVIRISSTSHLELPYGYTPNLPHQRLVITDLTTRAYLNHMIAIKHKKIMAALGPAGTGKTETMKDLAYNLGYDAMVINCSDQLDPSGNLDQILSSLDEKPKQTFVIFDEANRMEQAAHCKLAKAVNEKVCLGMTCNPGYAGRIELADEIRNVLQIIKMTVPDRTMILEVMLATRGFEKYEKLADLVFRFTQDMEQYCSKDSFYDFGLRMIKYLAVDAGKNYKSIKSIPDLADQVSDIGCIYQALISNIRCRFTIADQGVFEKFADHAAYFPGCAEKYQKYVEKFEPNYLLQNLNNRHGIIVKGENAQQVVEDLVAENSEKFEIFGKVETNFDELVAVMESQAKLDNCDKTRLILITEKWAERPEMCENLNTLLDDNREFRREKAESIALHPSVKLVTLVDQYDGFSPAFISRNGVYRA